MVIVVQRLRLYFSQELRTWIPKFGVKCFCTVFLVISEYRAQAIIVSIMHNLIIRRAWQGVIWNGLIYKPMYLEWSNLLYPFLETSLNKILFSALLRTIESQSAIFWDAIRIWIRTALTEDWYIADCGIIRPKETTSSFLHSSRTLQRHFYLIIDTFRLFLKEVRSYKQET